MKYTPYGTHTKVSFEVLTMRKTDGRIVGYVCDRSDYAVLGGS